MVTHHSTNAHPDHRVFSPDAIATTEQNIGTARELFRALCSIVVALCYHLYILCLYPELHSTTPRLSSLATAPRTSKIFDFDISGSDRPRGSDRLVHSPSAGRCALRGTAFGQHCPSSNCTHPYTNASNVSRTP
jgi:hypothetical protein